MTEQAPEQQPEQQQTPPAQTFDADYVAKLRQEAAKYRTDAKANADAAKRLAELEASSQSDTEKAIAKARQEADASARAELTAAFNRRLLTSEVRAAAGGKLNDPADAVRLLDLDSFEVGADGEVDAQAISKAIDELIATKPYLAADTRRFQGGADGGPRPVAPGEPRHGEDRLTAALRQYIK